MPVVHGAKRQVACLVSVGSLRFSARTVEWFSLWAKDRNADIYYVILDEPERTNLQEFEAVTWEKTAELVRQESRETASRLGLDENEWVGYREAQEILRGESWEVELIREFERAGAFRRHCLSQTFSNLQPRLRRHGVASKTDRIVGRLAFYLIKELALKLAIFNDQAFSGEILPTPEMDLALELYKGKYIRPPARREPFEISTVLVP